MRWAFLLALMLAAPDEARPSDRQAVVRLVETFVEGENAKDSGTINGVTWPEARFHFGQDRAYKARDIVFHGMGVWGEPRLGRPSVSIRGSRALVTVQQRERILYDTFTGRRGLHREFSGETFVGRNRVVLEKRKGEWRILSWHRTGQTMGSDVAWHRRNP